MLRLFAALSLHAARPGGRGECAVYRAVISAIGLLARACLLPGNLSDSGFHNACLGVAYHGLVGPRASPKVGGPQACGISSILDCGAALS